MVLQQLMLSVRVKPVASFAYLLKSSRVHVPYRKITDRKLQQNRLQIYRPEWLLYLAS